MKLFEKVRYKSQKEIRFLDMPIFSYGRYYTNNTIKEIETFFSIFPKENFRNIVFSNILQKFKKQYDHIYIIAQNIGETYLLISFYKDMINRDNAKSPLFLCLSKSQEAIFKMFDLDIPFIYCNDISISLAKAAFGKRTYLQDNVYFHIYLEKSFYDDFYHKISSNSDNQQYYYSRAILKSFGIKKDYINLKKPIKNFTTHENMLKKVQKINLNLDNFVLISPEAKTCKPYKTSFWMNLSKALSNKGYDVFFNITDSSNEIQDIKTVNLNLQEIYDLATLAKSIIGLRSGFMDLCSQINVPFYVLYTNSEYRNISAHNVLFTNTLKQFFKIPKDNLYEYDTKQYSEESILDEILKGF